MAFLQKAYSGRQEVVLVSILRETFLPVAPFFIPQTQSPLKDFGMLLPRLSHHSNTKLFKRRALESKHYVIPACPRTCCAQHMRLRPYHML